MVLGSPLACALAIVLACRPWASRAQAASVDQAGSGTGTKPGIDTTATPSLCEARTINYITHTLPQSCLRSSWAGSSLAADATHRSDGTPETGTAKAAASGSETQTADASPTSFMSFEDWKEMMLRRAGQDPQEWRSRRPSQQQTSEKSPPDAAHHAGLGEEDEIELNFDDYHGHDDSGPAANTAGRIGEGSPNLDETLAYGDAVVHRGKDAGKTCKERFSYASFDAGATILKTAAGAQNARAILVENKDTYMLLECSAPSKYVIVELSDDILIDTVVLANFEFFSSMIRHFRVSVSDRYPVKEEKWLELGLFEARNYRDIQPFLVENPQIWAKYVRVEFLTHYGNEYYCPLSLLRVHGSRMLDSWKDSETGREEHARQVEGQDSGKNLIQGDATLSPIMSASPEAAGNAPEPTDVTPWSSRFITNPFDGWVATCRVGESQSAHPPTASQTPDNYPGSPTPRQSAWAEKQQGQATPTPKSMGSGSKESPPLAPSPVAPGSIVASSGNAWAAGGNATGAGTTASAAADETPRERIGNATAATTMSKSPISGPVSGKFRTSVISGPTASPPTVQEGFFNAITKRLQQVESNLTLSLKYVEDQSRHVQEALLRGEQKQSSKITQFLDDLNRTVLSELRNVRDQYDQIWQSTVLALESQADRSERDMMALSARLNLLADEVVFQKRMAIVQAAILLSCLFLVIFSRGVPTSSLALPPPQPTTDALYDESPVRHDDFYEHRRQSRPPAHDTVSLALSTPNTGEGAGSAPRGSPLSAHFPGNLEATPPEYHSLSPPLTPGLSNQPRPSHHLASAREFCDSESNPARRLPCPSQVNSRKPLPSLPEHPSSLHES